MTKYHIYHCGSDLVVVQAPLLSLFECKFSFFNLKTVRDFFCFDKQ